MLIVTWLSFNQYQYTLPFAVFQSISIYSSFIYTLTLYSSSLPLQSFCLLQSIFFNFLFLLSTLCSNWHVVTYQSASYLSYCWLRAASCFLLYFFLYVLLRVLSASGLLLLFICSSFCSLLSFCFLLESAFFLQSASLSF